MRETQISQGYVFDGIRILVTADERGWDGGIRARLGCLPKCDDTQADLRFEFRLIYIQDSISLCYFVGD